MSEMVINQTIENTENADQKALELAQDFSYDGYQVVRRELFAHLREPAVVIRRDSVTFNTACIAGLEDAVYIQILVNQDNKRMVVRKCEENDKDALRWCIEKPDKRKSRKMSNKLFSAMMYDMMGWNTDCRYKILGHKITHENETMSIVGTRPPLISETNLYEPRHKARLAIKPGITGMWQVSGRSDITDFEEVVRLDKEYIENWDIH